MSPKVEVEVKIRVDCKDLSVVEEKLRSMRAVLEEDTIEEDIYYAHPCRSFLATDEALRLRAKKGKILLAYKGPRHRTAEKARTEIEFEVEGQAGELLERLGFMPTITIVKSRRYYRLPEGQLVTLDRVENLGCFIEVEAEDAVQVRRVVETLGIRGEEVRETYAELALKATKGGLRGES